ncbi:hypothetical protein DSP71_14315, partial [Microbacterium sp. H6]
RIRSRQRRTGVLVAGQAEPARGAQCASSGLSCGRQQGGGLLFAARGVGSCLGALALGGAAFGL